MRVYLSRRYRFSASHRLHTEALSDQANQATFGKCNNPFGHGHNYVVQVTFSGEPDPVTGMIVNLAAMDAFAATNILDEFNQTNLNLLSFFVDKVPTTENFTIAIRSIFLRFTGARLETVHVEETDNNSFHLAGTGLPKIGRY